MRNMILHLSEAVSNAGENKSKAKKKYKCPYCEMRLERTKLPIHIQNDHEDLIPEGYTALRVAFNTINHKTEGHCIICKSVTDWDEDKGRYNRLCNNPSCKEAYKKLVAERNQKVYGTDRLQTDPRYSEYVQRRALSGRRIAGKYRFSDGGILDYFGLYEKKFLEFMDTVMKCKSEDFLAPGPSIKYYYQGKEHLYIPDFYYVPYNLLIEIKDGGSNPNNHPKRIEEEAKNKAKEFAVQEKNEFNYVRVVNNDFSQLVTVMASIKWHIRTYKNELVVKVNESSNIYESSIFDDSEIINIKTPKEFSSWMKKNIKYSNFTKLKSAEEVITSKSGDCHSQCMLEHYWFNKNNIKHRRIFLIQYNSKTNDSSGGMTHTFIVYNDKNKFYWFENAWGGMEGIHGPFNSISDIKNKIKEEFKFMNNYNKYPDLEFTSVKNVHPGMTLQQYVNSCLNINESSNISEDMSGTIGAALPLTPTPTPYESNKDNYYIIQHPQNNVFSYGITKDPVQNTIFSVDPQEKGFYKVFKTDKGKIDKRYLTFKIKDNRKAKEIYDELAAIASSGKKVYNIDVYDSIIYGDYIYRRLTEGNSIIDPDQLFFDSRFELVRNPNQEIKNIEEQVYKYLTAKPIDILEEQVNQIEDYFNFDNPQFYEYNVLDDDIDNIQDLLMWKNKWMTMPYNYRYRSDDISREYYGQSNLERFSRLYSILINKEDPEDYIDNDSISGDSIHSNNKEIDLVTEGNSTSSNIDFIRINLPDDKLKRVRDAEAQGLVIMIDLDYAFSKTTIYDSIAKLKDKWNKYLSLSQDKRVLSNQTASSILGVDNETLYTRTLNAYLNKLDSDAINDESGSKESSGYLSIKDLTKSTDTTSPYYNPSDGDANNSTSSKIIGEYSFDEEYNYNKLLEGLVTRLRNTTNESLRQELKDEIRDLGWNPEIPFSEKAIDDLSNKYISIFKNIKEIDAESFIKESIDATETIDNKYTSEYLKDKIVPVFVILSHGVAPHSKGIQWFTDSEWSHAALSFDTSLNQMYTFTAGIDNAANKKHKNGFAIEDKQRYINFDKNLKLKIYALFVTPEQKKKMQEAVAWYIIHQDETSYSFKTIFNIFKRKCTKRASSEEEKCKMVCSQFVYTILKIVNFKMRKSKDSSLITPADIDELSDDARFYVVYTGSISEYNSKKVDKLCYDILPALNLDMYNINESINNLHKVLKSSIVSHNNNYNINRTFNLADNIIK